MKQIFGSCSRSSNLFGLFQHQRQSFHVTAMNFVFPNKRPYESDPKVEGKNWPEEYIEAKPIEPGQSMWALGLGRHFKEVERRVNIRRRVPSRVTQMVGGRRAKNFEITFDRGYVEREPLQGSRLGTEPYVMLRRKLNKFENIADAEAFAVYQGWHINRSNPNNFRFNPRVGLNQRYWKQSYYWVKDTYLTKDSGKPSIFPNNPHSHEGRDGRPNKAVITKRPSVE